MSETQFQTGDIVQDGYGDLYEILHPDIDKAGWIAVRDPDEYVTTHLARDLSLVPKFPTGYANVYSTRFLANRSRNHIGQVHSTREECDKASMWEGRIGVIEFHEDGTTTIHPRGDTK